MNWLTSRMAELSSFRDLYERAQTIGNIPIRLVPLKYIEDALTGIGAEMAFEGLPESLTSTFHVYAEDYSSDAPRAGMAPESSISRPIADPSFWFTTVLDDGKGVGLYLPDDDSDDQDVQFFTRDPLQKIGRVRLAGELTSASTQLNRFTRQEPEPGGCSDGYCTQRLGTACGDQCHCREIPDAARRVRTRLRQTRRFTGGVPIRVSVVKCTPDP